MKKLLLFFILLANTAFSQIILDQPPVIVVCNDTPFYTFNLTAFGNSIITNINPALCTITYHFSFQDSQTGANPIVQPGQFTTTMPNEQTIYIRVEETENPSNYAVTNFTITVISLELVSPLQDIELCSGFSGGNTTLDTGLSQQLYTFEWRLNENIIPGANQSSYQPTEPGEYKVIIGYANGACYTQDSATVTMSGLSNTGLFVTTNGQEITVNVNSPGDYRYSIDNSPQQVSNVFTNVPYGERNVFVQDGCGNIVILSVYVDTLTPLEIGTPESLSICVPYGSTDLPAFDLTVNDSIVLNGLNPDEYTVEYHNGNSFSSYSLLDSENHLIATNGQGITVKVTSNSNPGLFGTAMFGLYVLPTALITTVEPLIVEDSNNDGTGIIDLTSNYNEILNGQPAEITSIQYFLSEADALAAINPISNPQAFETGSLTIYYKLSMFTCSSIGSFNVILNSELSANKNTLTSLQYHPSPATNHITFTNNTAINSVEIYNQLGQKVISNNYNSNTVKADVSGLANGMYMVKVKSGNAVKTIKVIKQ